MTVTPSLPVGCLERGSERGHRWNLPAIQCSIKPADERTSRVQAREPRMATPYVSHHGLSHEIVFVLDVPEPVGRYRAAVAPLPVDDHEAHLRFTH